VFKPLLDKSLEKGKTVKFCSNPKTKNIPCPTSRVLFTQMTHFQIFYFFTLPPDAMAVLPEATMCHALIRHIFLKKTFNDYREMQWQYYTP